MPSASYTIEPFRNLPEPSEIVALGQIRRQSSRALEAEIEVVLASRLTDPAFDPEINVHRRWVGCGQIDLLTVGSRWKHGQRAEQVEAQKHSATYSLEQIELLGTGSDRSTDQLRRLPTSQVANAPCFLLGRGGAAEGDGAGPRKVLLPQIELVRALFGVSGRFLLQLIDGMRDPIGPDRGIIDRAHSTVLEDGTVRLVCWRRPTDEEALILAAMVAEPKIMRLHDEVLQQLIVQRDFREDRPTWPKITWPFVDSISLSIEGRWFQRENGFRRFLVTRIREIGLKLPFRRIEVQHPGSGCEDPADRLPAPTGRTRSTNARLLVLTTGKMPSPSRRPGEISSEPVMIEGAEGVKIEFIGKGGPSRPPTSTLGEDPRDEGEFSTASREGGGDADTGRVEVRRTAGADSDIPAPDKVEALRATWLAIRSAAASATWTVTPYTEALAGCAGSTDSGFDFTTGGILTGLRVDGHHVILADSGTAPGDRRSLGILLPRMGRPVNRSDLRAIRDAVESYGGRWGSAAMKINGFDIVAVRRPPKVWQDNDAYTALLLRSIGKAIQKSPSDTDKASTRR